ncbi:unnamed protein product [Acanthoscelides obtectus]|uniref:Trehalase n=1 Tax=Acanthoscelides obtectus TaxID=200917 RepID=A0A9P0NW28_ACAOB|nr:unnamed protein product [Acanthoscelides obtectus]CAK1668052.1 hypothetical protein AOBTE_LOCUS26197 [Acanthoscelides obtectus]
MKTIALIIVALSIVLAVDATLESCDSKVYCQGMLLDVVQQSHIFPDSKSFVDLIQIHSSEVTLRNFEELMKQTGDKPSNDELKEFVENNFVDEGELDDWTPPDFKSNPSILKQIDDVAVREFARSLIKIWPVLGKKMKASVLDKPDQHSLIPVPNGFIVPGGRFKEIYYWDSYWIIEGLLISEMEETAKGMLENFISLVEKYGFIPNGCRVYYLNRSQPPLLSLMVGLYIEATRDIEWLGKNVKTLESELNWWLNNRTVTVEKDGVKYQLAHYAVQSNTPRPESYREDIMTCKEHPEKFQIYECYTDLKSGAESGWDFSSRWLFAKDGSLSMDLIDINTRRNIPADLNAFLYRCFHSLSKFHKILNQDEQSAKWAQYAAEWKEAITRVLYNEEDGVWYDYDLKLGKHRKFFFASNLTPLWAGAFNEEDRQKVGGRAAEYLMKQGINDFRGGVPSSMYPSGQQWDYPNAWSPYQNLCTIGLHKSNNETAQELAKELAHKWVNSNVKAFHENKVMFEKYNAAQAGQFGGGGKIKQTFYLAGRMLPHVYYNLPRSHDH